jgi:c-di-AMP phosphodiesterase-like protein
MLGFTQNTIKAFGSYNGGPVVPSLILESPNKVMVNPITSVYIRSESLKFESNYEAIVTNVVSGAKSNFQNSDVLSKIPVNVLPNAIIYFRTNETAVVTNKELSELNLYISDNLSPTYTLDLQGLNYGIMVLFEEITIPQLNQYKDKIENRVEMPRQLLEERQQIIEDLKKQKEELEKEIKEHKENEKE